MSAFRTFSKSHAANSLSVSHCCALSLVSKLLCGWKKEKEGKEERGKDKKEVGNGEKKEERKQRWVETRKIKDEATQQSGVKIGLSH